MAKRKYSEEESKKIKRERSRKWHAEHKEERKVYLRNWAANNKDKKKAINERYWRNRILKELEQEKTTAATESK